MLYLVCVCQAITRLIDAMVTHLHLIVVCIRLSHVMHTVDSLYHQPITCLLIGENHLHKPELRCAQVYQLSPCLQKQTCRLKRVSHIFCHLLFAMLHIVHYVSSGITHHPLWVRTCFGCVNGAPG